MDAIEASSVNMRTLADGTLRIQCDVEPRFAQAAFNAFGSPGTAMALAALKVNGAGPASESRAAEQSDAAVPAPAPPAQPEPAKKAIGAICQWLVFRCKEPEFQAWLNRRDEASAALRVRELCEVGSRSEIDDSEKAVLLYHKKIRGPYSKYFAALTQPSCRSVKAE